MSCERRRVKYSLGNGRTRTAISHIFHQPSAQAVDTTRSHSGDSSSPDRNNTEKIKGSGTAEWLRSGLEAAAAAKLNTAKPLDSATPTGEKTLAATVSVLTGDSKVQATCSTSSLGILNVSLVSVSAAYSNSLWQEAMQCLPEKDRPPFEQDSYERIINDVLERTREQEKICERHASKFTWRGKEYYSREVADKIIAWAETFIRVGDTVMQYDPGHAALPWAGVRFILQVAVNRNQAMGTALVGIELVTNIMARTRVYEVLYLSGNAELKIRQTLKAELIELYASILKFLAMTRMYLLKKGLERTISAVFSTGELKSQLSSIEKQVSRVSETAAVAEGELRGSRDKLLEDILRDGKKGIEAIENNLRGLDNPIGRIGHRVEAIYVEVEEKKRFKILKWLSKIECFSHHKSIQKGILEGTGQWLMERPEYNEWYSSLGSSILWLYGNPGAGKTKLMSMVIQRLMTEESEHQATAYFYCYRNEEQRRDPGEILGALLKQLALSNEELPKIIVSAYDKQRRRGSGSSLDITEAQDLIAELANTKSKTIFLIDGLDEVDKIRRKELLDALKSIIESTSQVVKIFLSSRDNKDIRNELYGVPNLSIKAVDNAADIDRFITREIGQKIRDGSLLGGEVPDDLREHIESTISGKAQGMFQWVDLQIKFICEFQIKSDIAENLGRLPDTLEKSYAMLYQRIEDTKGATPEIVKKALMWLMSSAVPLTAQNWVEVVDWAARMDSREGLNMNQLLDLCRYLVFVDKESGIVRFAHLSVREFLEKKFTNNEAHFMIAECCAAHLNRTAMRETTENKPLFKSLFEVGDPNKAPISHYSHFFWARHARACRSNKREWYHISKFLQDPCSYGSWLNTVGHKTWEEPIPSAIPVYHPIMQVLTNLQSNPPNPMFIIPYIRFDISVLGSPSHEELHVYNSLGKSLLYIASLHGHTQIVRLLLNGKPGVQNYQCVKPLARAVERRRHTVVEILQKHIISQGYTESLAVILFRTARRSYISQKIFGLMGTEVTEAVLVSALANPQSNTKLIQYLLEKADPSAVTPVVVAAMVGNKTRICPIHWSTTVLEDLLQKNPYVKLTADLLVKSLGAFGTSTDWISSPFMVGITKEDITGIGYFSTAVIEVLLSRIEPNNIESACLNVAACFGELTLFNRLLAKGVPFPLLQGELAALLIDAIQGQNEFLVERVTEHIGWIHHSDEHGWTPCQIAKLCGQEHLTAEKCLEPHNTEPLIPSEWTGFPNNSIRVHGLELVYEAWGRYLIARANHPIPPGKPGDDYYFEVEILECGQKVGLDFGFCTKYDLHYKPTTDSDRIESIKTGAFFHRLEVYGGYKAGDILGCSSSGTGWLNGKLISQFDELEEVAILYPAVGFDGGYPVRVRANFTGPFKHGPPSPSRMPPQLFQSRRCAVSYYPPEDSERDINSRVPAITELQ